MAITKEQLGSVKVGQIMAHVDSQGRAKECKVTRVGREYFYTIRNDGMTGKWSKENGRFIGNSFGYGNHLWFSMDVLNDHNARIRKYDKIGQLASNRVLCKLTDDQLDSILNILEAANGN